MKKIGIVSCYFQPNYGSMLQAYATQRALEKLGFENETIDISGFNHDIRKKKIKYFIKASFTSKILFTKLGRLRGVVIQRLKKNEYTKNIQIRKNAFDRFEKKYFNMSKVYNSIDELGQECVNYRAILVGSDQLWLPCNIAADYYTLNFVPTSINSIAYATSFGQSELPDSIMKPTKSFLERIKHISVREETGAKLINDITGRKVPVVCDPTLLFTGDEWKNIQEEKAIIDGKYIFVYFLGNNFCHREFVKKLKNVTGMKVVCLPHIDEYVKADEDCSDVRLYNIDPGQFLNMIRYAEYVCTDSFHCSVFSIQYNKKFFAFKRFSDGNKQSTNSRLTNLFKSLGIENSLLCGDENINEVMKIKINYNSVNEHLKENRDISYKYLKEAIEDKGSTDL